MTLNLRLALLIAFVVAIGLSACTPPALPPSTLVDGLTTLNRTLTTSTPASISASLTEVKVYESSITLPTYPYERYQQDAIDPLYRWPYKTFDMDRFRTEAPQPESRPYRLVVLENAYLQVLLLPEVGGRIWQVIHKASGAPMFYQNKVVKPTHWGQAKQRGWLALGGLEWGLPVNEHGYDWGVAWEYTLLQAGGDTAVVQLSTPQDGRLLQASITITLPHDRAYFTVTPTLVNVSEKSLPFSFWIDAMLAPGSGSHPSAQLHFVLPTKRVAIHSTADATLPLPQQTIPWPIYRGRDLSRLGNWRQYLGFFESPTAYGPFAAVYDPAYDSGAVRVFPATVAQGSKIFALGWQDRLASANFTDDDSYYVELHGGLAPSFFQQTELGAGAEVAWREVWYPAQGIGDLTFANELGALNVQPVVAGLRLRFYPTQPVQGDLVIRLDGEEVARLPVHTQAATPWEQVIQLQQPDYNLFTVHVEDSKGQVLMKYASN